VTSFDASLALLKLIHPFLCFFNKCIMLLVE
jgi:hypothetical protein